MVHQHLPPARGADPYATSPNAALLIDFDNVTLGIRSDLTKELKSLLGSDIIKGKVAVQRAYADWRRYPQYVVALSERSIDLIFAPAVGSTTKKNATDIRLAIDAMELVFTRPEIGTFILLSGDSDFSSLVVKLKEYGKYVIGVGIRESASDLLIQNCDEYFSYSELAGLTKESDAAAEPRDPWELVREAVAQMARNKDVMRADRLKQVMQQIDPAFDERNAGFNRFSKFVTDAAAKGLLKVTKLETGQYEIAPVEGAAAAPAAAPATRGAAAERPARTEEERDEKDERAGRRRRRGRRGRGPERGERSGAAGGDVEGEAEAGSEVAAGAAPTTRESVMPLRREGGLTLAKGFDLLRSALAELKPPVAHEQVRNRMAALHGRDDDFLDSSRFLRFLRQANDAEVADVRKVGDDEYEVMPYRFEEQKLRGAVPTSNVVELKADGTPATPAAPVITAGLRFRRGSGPVKRPSELLLVGAVDHDEPAPVAAVAAVPQLQMVLDEVVVPSAAAAGAGTRRGGRGKPPAKAPATKAAAPAAKAPVKSAPKKSAKAAAPKVVAKPVAKPVAKAPKAAAPAAKPQPKPAQKPAAKAAKAAKASKGAKKA